MVRPRVIGYATALSAMVIVFTIALVGRNLVGIDVIRDRGELFHADRDAIRNDYTLKIINKTQQPQTLVVSVTPLRPNDPQPRLEGPTTIATNARRRAQRCRLRWRCPHPDSSRPRSTCASRSATPRSIATLKRAISSVPRTNEHRNAP